VQVAGLAGQLGDRDLLEAALGEQAPRRLHHHLASALLLQLTQPRVGQQHLASMPIFG
jgi:hypothetical protein